MSPPRPLVRRFLLLAVMRAILSPPPTQIQRGIARSPAATKWLNMNVHGHFEAFFLERWRALPSRVSKTLIASVRSAERLLPPFLGPPRLSNMRLDGKAHSRQDHPRGPKFELYPMNERLS